MSGNYYTLGQGRGRCINPDSFRLGRINHDYQSLLNVLLSLPGIDNSNAAILLGESFDPVTGIWRDVSINGNDFPPDTNAPTAGALYHGRKTVDFRGTKAGGDSQALQVPLAVRDPSAKSWTVLCGAQTDTVGSTAGICNLGKSIAENGGGLALYGPYLYASVAAAGGNWISFFGSVQTTNESLATMRQIACSWAMPRSSPYTAARMYTDGPGSPLVGDATALALTTGATDDHAALGADGLLADAGIIGLNGFMTHFIGVPGVLSNYDIDRARQALQDFYGFPP